MYHAPVLLTESVAGLDINQAGIYVDATFGGGGHSREILKALGNQGRLLVIDQDEAARGNMPADARCVFIHGNFRYLRNYLKYLKIEAIDGVLADLGVSSHHFDNDERGFSYKSSGELDMRMNIDSLVNAGQILTTYNEKQLTELFRSYGELPFAHKLATDITSIRAVENICATPVFVGIVDKYCNHKTRNKILAQVFQALRIEVNDEINALVDFLEACRHCIRPNGRLSVISYHSLEDRLVKNFIKSGNRFGKEEHDIYGLKPGPWRAVNRKVIVPDEHEFASNSRSRSAKLRIAIRTNHG